jgi:hypothetical protein
MGEVKARGANVISFSGTTGTTNLTRAVSFTMALSQYWKHNYRMSSEQQGNGGLASLWKKVKISGIMTASLPGFIAVSLLLSIMKFPYLIGLQETLQTLSLIPPVILAVIAAKKVSDLGEISLIAGVISGLLSVPGGIIGAIIGGIGAGFIATYLFRLCTLWKLPATTVNIISGGVAGIVPGLIVFYILAPYAFIVGEGIRYALDSLLHFNPAIIGLSFGLLMWPAIMRGGMYHIIVLPLILLEMEKYGYSYFGALDMAGLVMVSAGILLAQIVVATGLKDRDAAKRPFWMNIGFGTFVEASYPYMRENKIVYAGAILSSGLAGLFIGILNLKATAYVPFYISMLLSNNGLRFLAVMTVVLATSFCVTLGSNLLSNKAQRNDRAKKEGKG